MAALGPALWGCATSESAKAARGAGVKRTFRYRFADVRAAALEAAARRNLEVVDCTSESGTILLSHGPSLGSLGEHIAIFVTQLNEKATSVEVVSRPVVPTVSFPPDWPALLFGDMDEVLAARRLAR
jgi:hypothetical protein